MIQPSPARWLRSVLILGVLAFACAISAPAHAQATYVGTAHTQIDGAASHPILGTLRLTLHEDEHGHPLSVVGDDPETGHHNVFNLEFMPKHGFQIRTISGTASGVFTVQVPAENVRHYRHVFQHAVPHANHILRIVGVDWHKVSAREIALNVHFDEHDFVIHSYYGFRLRATLHLKVPSSH